MASLEKAIRKVLSWEGGYANDPDDTGGETMRGVTMNTYKEYCRKKGLPAPTSKDLRNISYSTILDLADTLFWSRIKGNDINNQSIADLCFDCVWGSGNGYIKVIQQVLGVKADCVVGPITINKINSWNPQRDLFNKLWNRRKTYLEGCKTAWKYLRGWMNRLNSYKFEEEPVKTAPVKEIENEIEEHPIESQTVNTKLPQENNSTKINDLTLLEKVLLFFKELFKIK